MKTKPTTVTKTEAILIANLALLESCGVGTLSDVRLALKGTLSKSERKLPMPEQDKIITKALVSGFAGTRGKVDQILHDRVLHRVAEDTEMSLPEEDKVKGRINWVDYLLNPSYAKSLNLSFSNGSFYECMYIKQASRVANDVLLPHYQRLKTTFLTDRFSASTRR